MTTLHQSLSESVRNLALEEAAIKADKAIKDYALTGGDKSPGTLAAIAYQAIRSLKTEE